MVDVSLVAQEVEAKIRHYAVGLLAKRDYASLELQGKLAKKYSDEIHKLNRALHVEVVAWLQDLGYLNDEKYCQMFIRAGVFKGRGALRIRQELKQRKLPVSLIDAAFECLEVDWVGVAQVAAERKFKTGTLDLKTKTKLIRFLQYRGFATEEIYIVIQRWGEVESSVL